MSVVTKKKEKKTRITLFCSLVSLTVSEEIFSKDKAVFISKRCTSCVKVMTESSHVRSVLETHEILQSSNLLDMSGTQFHTQTQCY